MDQRKIDAVPDREFIFGLLFNTANHLQKLLDREFAGYGITAKQWFMTIVMASLFDAPPTLGEVAAAMGSTHQNAKQVALKLQATGFIELHNDARDGRAVRLVLTDKCRALWAATEPRGNQFMADVFNGLSADDMAALRRLIRRVSENIASIDARKEGTVK